MDGIKLVVISFLAVVVCLTVSLSDGFAGTMKRFDKSNQTCRIFSDDNVWSGYYTFRTVCKTCHTRESEQGASFLYTESKTRRGWDRVFSELYPACVRNGSWDKLTKEDRANLNDYLYMKAAGNYDPNCAA